jgi:hypothetical protein
MISCTRPFRIALVALALLAGSCAAGPTPPSGEPAPAEDFVSCEDPRPEMCTRDYRPVCGARDTGVRCITTPCPSTEWKTYGNACTACSDPEVAGHRPGECPAS